MGTNVCLVLFWLGILYPSVCSDMDVEPDLSEDRWMYRHRHRNKMADHPPQDAERCSRVRPTGRDVVRRFYAILPFLDKGHANAAFLHKFRGTIHGMSANEDVLDREGAFYAAVLVPLLFLQLREYQNTWCLLERFHRALRLYQISHPTEKRAALKLLQNFRAVNLKIRQFIRNLPGQAPLARATTHPQEEMDEELRDKKDIRYLKELIKNLG